MSSSPMTGCVSLAVTGRFSESSFVPAGTMNGPRDLPVTGSRLGLLMLVGVPMNIGFGSFSFSSSVACRAASGASTKASRMVNAMIVLFT